MSQDNQKSLEQPAPPINEYITLSEERREGRKESSIITNFKTFKCHPCPELLEHVWIDVNERKVLDIDGKSWWEFRYWSLSPGWYRVPSQSPSDYKMPLEEFKARFCEQNKDTGVFVFKGTEYMKEIPPGATNKSSCVIS